MEINEQRSAFADVPRDDVQTWLANPTTDKLAALLELERVRLGERIIALAEDKVSDHAQWLSDMRNASANRMAVNYTLSLIEEARRYARLV